MKARKAVTALIIISSLSLMIIFMSGRLSQNKTESEDSVEQTETSDAFADDAETGDFLSFPSESVSTPEPETEDEEDTAVVLPTTIEGGLTIRNDTSYTPDLEALMSETLTQVLPAEGAQVLIIHTHGSESYTPDEMNEYTPSDTYRTEDKNFSVIRVGDELTACLESYGIKVIHDREIYDYPSYTGSYGRSADAIEQYLEDNPNIAVVLDIHRDAIGSGDVVYKTVAEGSGEPSSQIMILVGTGENGLEHPNWTENLKFALCLQSAAVEKYPTLMRPIALKQERYNQHLTTGSLILEVGSSGNTLSEALCAIRLFADAIAPQLLELVE